MGKEGIARNEQFLLFPHCFLLNQIIVSPFVHMLHIISLFAAEFEEPRIGISGKGLIVTSCITQRTHIHVLITSKSSGFASKISAEGQTRSFWMQQTTSGRRP